MYLMILPPSQAKPVTVSPFPHRAPLTPVLPPVSHYSVCSISGETGLPASSASSPVAVNMLYIMVVTPFARRARPGLCAQPFSLINPEDNIA